MTENVLYPGRPDYTGPTCGLFGWLHHDLFYEWSDNVVERVDYIKQEKPTHEVAMRLHCMVYIEEAAFPVLYKAWAEYNKAWAECNKAWVEYNKALAEYDKALAEYNKALAEYDKALAECNKARDAHDKARDAHDKAWAEYNKALDECKSEVEVYMRRLVPDAPWNGCELVFKQEE